jgi:hypothetical protein
MRISRWLAGMASTVAIATSGAAYASEGAASYYFAGGFGSFLVAVPPEPGLTVASQTLMFGGQTQRAVLNGRQTFGLSAFALYEYIGATYAFEQPVLGGRLQIGGAAPVIGYATTTASLQTRLFGTFSNTAEDTGFGDTILTPFSLAWNSGDFNAKFSQLVIVPTGHYDVTAPMNVGRNYWAFDSQVALTWFHKATGTEISVLPGIMLNTTNPATNYRTGTEFHLDFMLNQFVAPTIAIGAQGYWYKQVDGDSGSGATLGAFMGESFGLGPAVLWTPEALKGKSAIVLKWLHDISQTNRLNGDWGMVQMSFRF